VTAYAIVIATGDGIATRTEIETGANAAEIARTRSEIIDERTVTATLVEKLILATTTDTGDHREGIAEATVIGGDLNIVAHTLDVGVYLIRRCFFVHEQSYCCCQGYLIVCKNQFST
jgi:hypothetical protein